MKEGGERSLLVPSEVLGQDGGLVELHNDGILDAAYQGMDCFPPHVVS